MRKSHRSSCVETETQKASEQVSVHVVCLYKLIFCIINDSDHSNKVIYFKTEKLDTLFLTFKDGQE